MGLTSAIHFHFTQLQTCARSQVNDINEIAFTNTGDGSRLFIAHAATNCCTSVGTVDKGLWISRGYFHDANLKSTKLFI